MRIAILVSGRGSNLAALLEAVDAGRLAGVDPVLVVSNRPDAMALAVAARHGVPSRVLRRADFVDASARDAAAGAALTSVGADLALLAGYDQLLHPAYFAAFGGRTMNIHPSLLPRHGGRGMVGLAVHASVLAAGDRETGVTIHDVTADLDAGPVVAQIRLSVRPGERVEELAARVLAAEHALLVDTLARLAAERGSGEPSASMTAAPRMPISSAAHE